MKIVFIKNHCGFKAGDAIEDHPNADYLLRCRVAVEAEVDSVEQLPPVGVTVVSGETLQETVPEAPDETLPEKVEHNNPLHIKKKSRG
jgi:hypothetical protein